MFDVQLCTPEGIITQRTIWLYYEHVGCYGNVDILNPENGTPFIIQGASIESVCDQSRPPLQ